MTNNATVLFAVRIENEDWQEELITEHADQIEPASTWALANGFNRLRVATIGLSVPPDFTKTINRK
jgi:hypothetical protein